MLDRVSNLALPRPTLRGSRPPEPVPPVRTLVLRAAAVLAAYAAAGAVAGWLWFQLWTPPEGRVTAGRWYTTETGLREAAAGGGWYAVVAVGCGLLLGAAVAVACRRGELVTLVLVVAGSALAAWLMWFVGRQLGPPDPAVLARSRPDGARLQGVLSVGGVSPFLAFPIGSLAGLAVVFLLPRRERNDTERPPAAEESSVG